MLNDKGYKTVSVKLQPDDLIALNLIKDFLRERQWFPHIHSGSTAIRYALRHTVASLADKVQKEARAAALEKSKRQQRRWKKRTKKG